MNHDDMLKAAVKRVELDNAEATEFKPTKTYDQILDGTIVTVTFKMNGKEESNHVHFDRSDQMKVFRWHSDIIQAVAGYRERNFFFRFIELAGIGGVIAFLLILVFSVLLSFLAFSRTSADPTILEVVKLSFSIILGFFFGSQSANRKTT
jgi:hypothetical protein